MHDGRQSAAGRTACRVEADDHLCASRSLHTFRPMDGVPCDKWPTDGQTEEGTVSAHFCHFPKVTTIQQPVRLRKLSQVRFRPQSTRSSTELGSKGFPQKHQRKMFGTWPWAQMDIWKTEPLGFGNVQFWCVRLTGTTVCRLGG